MNIPFRSPRVRWLGAALLLAAASLPLAFSLAPAGAGPKAIPFPDARLKIEVNGTDGDAGLQVFLDGPAWREVTITDPNGREVLEVEVGSVIQDYGLTELFSESSEPPFEEFPFAEFKKLFPEGKYTFRGTTIDGEGLVGHATLSHRVPETPQIVAPSNGSQVPSAGFVVRWQPAATPQGIKIAGYQILVVAENPLRVLSADLPASATSLPIPAEFLLPGTYKVEVLAVEANGNQTLAEVEFTVE